MYFRSRKYLLTGMAPSEYEKFWRQYTTQLAVYDNSIVYRLNIDMNGHKPASLIELPGMQEADLGEVEKNLYHQHLEEAYKRVKDWVDRYPDLAEGLGQKSLIECSMGLCNPAIRNGERAWAEGLKEEDLCQALSSCFGKLKQRENEKKWMDLGLQRRLSDQTAIRQALTYYGGLE